METGVASYYIWNLFQTQVHEVSEFLCWERMWDVISFAHAVWWLAENPSVSLGKWGLLQAAGSWGEEALPVFFSHWGVMWYVCSLSLGILLFLSVCWLYNLIILNSSSDLNGCPPSLVALYQLVSHGKLIISLFPSFKVLKGDSNCGVNFLELPQEAYDSYGLTPWGSF